MCVWICLSVGVFVDVLGSISFCVGVCVLTYACRFAPVKVEK